MAHCRMALCDSNVHYGRKLADYLENQKGFPYEVMHFSEWEQLERYRKSSNLPAEHLTHMILSEEMLPYLKNDTSVRKIFLLTKQEEQTEYTKDRQTTIVPIYRYQPAGNIMRRMIGSLETEERHQRERPVRTSGVEIVGVYTPVRRCMQTSFSVLLGQFLTRRKRTLYLNLEGISGFRVLFGKDLKPNITDFLYYAERDSEKFMMRLEQMIDCIGELEYIPPAATFMDLMSVTQEQWLHFLNELARDGRFGYIVLDLTEQVQGLFSILERCDIVYTIESDDGVANAKIREYEQMLWMLEHENVLQKIHKKQLPKVRHTDIDFSQLIYSELAEYVRRLVEEDFGEEC